MSVSTEPSPAQENSSRIGHALALLGDSWTLLIIQRISLGEHRYTQIRSSLHISDSILAARLDTLARGGVVLKKPYKEGRTRFEYHLTSSGKATWRIFFAAYSWQNAWVPPLPGPQPVMVHKHCGQPTEPSLICGRCDLPVAPRETSVTQFRATLSYVGSIPRRHRQSRTFESLDRGLFVYRNEVMELLGDRWNTAMLASAVLGIRRFSDFERFLGIPPTVLSARITRFVELGILQVNSLAGATKRSDYRLTAKGRAASAILVQIVRWADENIRSDHERSLEIIHDVCGRKLLPELICSHCQEKLRHRDVLFELRER